MEVDARPGEEAAATKRRGRALPFWKVFILLFVVLVSALVLNDVLAGRYVYVVSDLLDPRRREAGAKTFDDGSASPVLLAGVAGAAVVGALVLVAVA